jgi:TolA-binding protein
MIKFKIYLLFFLISFSVFGLNKSEIIKMAKMGLSESTLIATVNGSKDVIVMEKADIIEMKKAGVPTSVIKVLIKRYLKNKETVKKDEVKKDEKKTTVDEAKKLEEEKAKAIEEAKIRAEEQKKAEERIQKRKSAQQEREYKEKRLPLDRAIQLYNKKEYLSAIKKLDKFFKAGFKPNSEEYYLANFYLGMSFYKSKAYYSAIDTLKDVLVQGPEVKIGNNPKGAYFMLAFEAYGEMTGNWPFSSDFNETYQMISTYNIALLPKKFHSVYNYYMGKYYSKWASNSSKAERYLSNIENTKNKEGKIVYSPYYPSAEYFLGLNNVKSKKYNESVKHFQNVILGVEGKTNFKDTSLRDLAYIALGRIYYEIASSYFSVGGIEQAQRLANASLESYRKVSKDSPKLATAYYEASWAAFITSEYDVSLGYLHALNSSYLKDYYYPDKYILEAGIYVNMCLFKYADEAVSAFKKKYDPLKKELDDFLSEPIEPKEYLEKIKNIAEHKQMKGKRFSYGLVSYIISDGYFYESYNSLKDIQTEKSVLSQWSKKGKSKIVLLNKLYVQILKKESKLYQALGSWIRRKLQNASNNLNELYLKSDEISFEIISAEKRVLQDEKLALTNKTQVKKSNKATSSKEYTLKDDEMMWKFIGEYWIDEIDNYRSFLQSKCK